MLSQNNDVVKEFVSSPGRNPFIIPHSIGYPVNGFLRFPLPVLREYGELTRTLSALWAIPSIRQGGKACIFLSEIANKGCLPLRTFKRQLAKLEEKGAVINHGRRPNGPFPFAKTSLELTPKIHTFYTRNPRKAKRGKHSVLRIPRFWFHLSLGEWPFCELMLYAYYRFTCRVLPYRQEWDSETGNRVWQPQDSSYCMNTVEQLKEVLGFSERALKQASANLAWHGWIIRRRLPNRNYAVWIPDHQPAYRPEAVWQEFNRLDFSSN